MGLQTVCCICSSYFLCCCLMLLLLFMMLSSIERTISHRARRQPQHEVSGHAFLHVGMEITKHKNIRPQKSMRDLRATFGASPQICSCLWTLKTPKARIDRAAQPMHLLGLIFVPGREHFGVHPKTTNSRTAQDWNLTSKLEVP